MDTDAIKRTSRGRGAVGIAPLPFRVLVRTLPPPAKVLDFGCGRYAAQVAQLREMGYDAVGCDLWHPGSERHIIPGAYDAVLLSNVLNVQPNPPTLKLVIDQAASCVRPGGLLLCNYPEDPRKTTTSKGWVASSWLVKSLLAEAFGHSRVLCVGGRKSPVWVCTQGGPKGLV
ncbi:MAG: methyltransferase domain-containing protein [Deltaproteobacteria bacterium]|nr:methyltransferase domain-containing protein [Deltaproteobacteria bacterium]